MIPRSIPDPLYEVDPDPNDMDPTGIGFTTLIYLEMSPLESHFCLLLKK